MNEETKNNREKSILPKVDFLKKSIKAIKFYLDSARKRRGKTQITIIRNKG